ncbi:hypothetical protein Ccrd_003473 [Cynara cardunculus var. scolymus]|uniref:Uncharacterized protein n=1 Tax=Cynara cardunculus var. scolymus TaxID=59895 RepID=A0A103XP95_CYNCS|nr:hypothetical protein Ccrd_003473 [Cynara cardunculus var. scolymus]
MKPQHISNDTSMIHECKRVGERLRQAFQATVMAADSQNGSIDSERRVQYAKETNRPKRKMNVEDPMRTIMFLGSWSHT